MKILPAILIAAVASLPACARGITPSSNIVTKTVAIGNFDEIEVSRADLIVHIGTPTGTAKISAPDNLINELHVGTKGDELNIRFPNNFNIKGNPRTTVEITVGSLKEIDAALSSKVEVRGVLSTAGELDLSTSTSAKILIGKASAAECDIETSTSGTVSIQQLSTSGKTDIDANTSGSVKINTIQCSKFSAEANTSSSVTVNSGKAGSADFEANTSGSINASGLTAQNGKAEASTGASVKCNIATPGSMNTSTGGSISNK